MLISMNIATFSVPFWFKEMTDYNSITSYKLLLIALTLITGCACMQQCTPFANPRPSPVYGVVKFKNSFVDGNNSIPTIL